MLDNSSQTSYIPEALQKEIDIARKHLDTLKSEEVSMRGIIVALEHETITREKYLEDVNSRCELFDGRVADAKEGLAKVIAEREKVNDEILEKTREMAAKSAELQKREDAVAAKEAELNATNERLLASMLETAKAKDEAEKTTKSYNDKISKIKEIILWKE